MNNCTNNYKYILSIIIPTRNREDYAYAAAMQVLEATNDDIQLVLQDNSDSNSLLSKFKGSPFLSRIKYNHSNGVLSFVDNFSEGVALADGEYLCIIGDDDGINPEIVDFVYWAKINNIEAVVPEIKLNYIWPNTGIPYYKNDTGNLMIVNFNMKAKIFSTKDEINKLLYSGGQNYLKFHLVKIYHGIVKKIAMDKVKDITGKYFGGLSPDIYSSVALSLVVDTVLKVDYPLTIPGVCRESGSGQAANGRHLGKLEDAPHLIGHLNYQWSNLVPEFYSVETVWADSAIAAFNEMKRDDLVHNFNVHALTVYCYCNHKEFIGQTKTNYTNYCKSNNINRLQQKKYLFLAFIKGPLKGYLVRVINKLTRKRKAIEKYVGIKNISEAEHVFSNYLKHKSLSVKDMFERLINSGIK